MIDQVRNRNVRDQIRRWIHDHSGRSVTDTTPIFERGVLSSLDVVELILFIEDIKGESIDFEDVDPEIFTSIDTIVAGFFNGNEDG